MLPQDPVNSTFLCKVQLPSAPVLLSVSGLFDVEWRISVICRDGRMYSVKSGDVRGTAVLSGQVGAYIYVYLYIWKYKILALIERKHNAQCGSKQSENLKFYSGWFEPCSVFFHCLDFFPPLKLQKAILSILTH